MKLESNDYRILNSYTLNWAAVTLTTETEDKIWQSTYTLQPIPNLMFVYQINKPTITLIVQQCLTLLFYQHSRENNFL